MSSATRPSPGRRVAAVGALSALLAIVVVVILGLVRDPLRHVAVVVLTVGAVLAAWTALVHRRARRVVAATVAACALAGAVVLLLSGSVLRLALVVGLVAVSVAATRVALGAAPGRPAPSPSARPVPASC